MLELSELKTYLKITVNTSDDQLNLAISNAKGFLEGYLGYSLELNDAIVATFFWSSSSFDLDRLPIRAVISIKYGSDEFSTLSTYSGNKKEYLSDGLIKTQESIGPYTEITYSAGYDSGGTEQDPDVNPTPKDLKLLLLKIAAMSYKSMWQVSQGDLKSESVDGDSVSFNDYINILSPMDESLLAKYKDYGFSA